MSVMLRNAESVADIQTAAVWQVYPGFYLLIGHSPAQIAKAGSARALAATSGLGVFRGDSWQLSDRPGYGFVLAVRMPGITASEYMGEIALRGSRLADSELRLNMVKYYSERELGLQLAELSAKSQAQVARFLIEVMTADEGSEQRKLADLLDAFLGQAAHFDGFIELVLSIHDEQTILQGWGTPISEPVWLLTPGANQLLQKVTSCEFQRSDVLCPSTGCIIVIDARIESLISNPVNVFLLTNSQLLARRAVGSQTLIADDALGQLRHLLPKLQCPPSIYDKFKDLLLPKYQCIDTLHTSGKPVRAAIDLAVASVTGDVYISGWLLDPAKLVNNIEVSNGNDTQSILPRIVWVEREDVVRAFENELASDAISNRCGFCVSLKLSHPIHNTLYVKFSFINDDVAYMPITDLELDNEATLDRLLCSVDLHKNSGAEVVDRALGPFLKQSLPSLADRGESLSYANASNSTAIIIPLYEDVLPRSTISEFFCNDLLVGERVFFVCGQNWDKRKRESLRNLINLYGLDIEIVSVNLSVAPVRSLLHFVHLTGATKVIVLASNTTGLSGKTRERIYDQLDDFDFVCPAIAHEDQSVRYAGSLTIETLEQAPFSRVRARPPGALLRRAFDASKTTIIGGSLACCGMRSEAVASLRSGPIRLSRIGGEAALFMKAESLGFRSKWDDSLAIIAPDDNFDEPLVRHVVDAWLLRGDMEASRCAH